MCIDHVWLTGVELGCNAVLSLLKTFIYILPTANHAALSNGSYKQWTRLYGCDINIVV